ncbi:MAG: proteasome subunit beta [Candidatus Geothermarchaeota archaeon]
MYMFGGTAIGLATKNGVILAADRRFTYENLIIATGVRKIFMITDYACLAAAGLVSDFQQLVRDISYIVRIREIELGRRVPIKSIAKLVSLLLYNNKLYPLLTQVLIGGYVDKPTLISLDPLGSLIEDKYVAVGSGAEIAIGILDSSYSDDLSIEDGRKIVIESFNAVTKRDALSGKEIDIAVIRQNGYGIDTVVLG